MVKSIRYNIGLFILVAVLGCKTAQINEHNDQYFTISLYSKGEGIDHEAKNMVDNTIAIYHKKGHEINYTATHWGREGEIDYCFNLQNLDPSVYKSFWIELNNLLKDRQVHVKEKIPCKSYQ